ncbi:putative CRISPR-associated protein [Thermofilum sp.]|uniref:putative CRISPR-associated protein n=3 Tax=Thermofilum sp. TaxID=1961369 RepID=UPI00316815C2
MDHRRIAHIVTVGTSIVRNLAQNASGQSVSSDILEKFKRWAQASPRSREDAEAGERACSGCEEFEAGLRFLASKPYEVSAELNAMRSYLEEGMVDAVVLLSSDTGVSEFSGRLLEAYLSSEGKQVETIRVPGLGLDFQEGLINLVDTVAGVVARYRGLGYRAWINLTGGFKLEAAVLYLVSCLSRLGVEKAYYIHEAMRSTVEVPAIPVKLEDSMLRTVEQLGDQEVELEEARKRIGDEMLDVLLRSGLVERRGTTVRIRKWVLHLVRGF